MRNFLKPTLLVVITISTVALGISAGRGGHHDLHVVEDTFSGYEGFGNITGGLGGDGGAADSGGGDSGKGTGCGKGDSGRMEVDVGYKGERGGVGVEIHFRGRKGGGDCGSDHGSGGVEIHEGFAGGGHSHGSRHGGGGDYNVSVGDRSVGDKN